MKKLLLILLCVPLLYSCAEKRNISETEFLDKLRNNDIKKVTFVTNTGLAEIDVVNNSGKEPHFSFNYGGDTEYLNNKID